MKRISATCFFLFWFLFLFGCMKPVSTAPIRSAGTTGEFNVAAEDLRNIIYLLDSIACLNSRCSSSVSPGSSGDIKFDLTLAEGSFKGLSSHCVIDIFSAAPGVNARTGVKVRCFEDMMFVGDYAQNEKSILASIAKSAAKTSLDKTAASPPGLVKERVAETVKSDIDELPAFKAKPNKNAYAIVIGIESYRQKLPRVDFAAGDARLMREYLSRAMGYPEENIITLLNENATNVDLAKYLEQWLANNVEKGDSVFIYYSGHGAPNPKTGDAYLVPYDGDPSFIDKTGYPLNRMYEALGKLPAKEIIVALDSCFSGAGGRSVIAEGSRPLVMNLEKSLTISKNMTVLAAASGDQISSTYKEKGHGLFTYFLLKGIKNEDVVKQDGSIAIHDLFTYVKPQVERIARKQYNNEQTPQLIAPESAIKSILLQR
jgi:hypothetical protein